MVAALAATPKLIPKFTRPSESLLSWRISERHEPKTSSPEPDVPVFTPELSLQTRDCFAVIVIRPTGADGRDGRIEHHNESHAPAVDHLPSVRGRDYRVVRQRCRGSHHPSRDRNTVLLLDFVSFTMPLRQRDGAPAAAPSGLPSASKLGLLGCSLIHSRHNCLTETEYIG